MRPRTSLARGLLASACVWATSAAAQQTGSGTATGDGRFSIDGSTQAKVGAPWTASATGCVGSVEWTIDGADADPPPGAGVSLTWDERGIRRVTAGCEDGREARMVVVVADGDPFVEVAEVVNRDGAEITFAERLTVDAAYADAPEDSTLRMVLYRGSAPVTGGGRAEIIDDSSGIARVDGYCLSPGPIHHIEIVLEDMKTAERYAGSGRIKVRKRKLQCVE